jgi:hypothetical protein
MTRPTLLATLILTCAACAPSAPQQTTPATEELPAPPPDAEPSGAPATSASAAPAPADTAQSDAKKPPLELPFKGEDPGDTKKLSGERAWKYWPEYNGIGLSDLKEVKGTKAVFYAFGSRDETFTVPLAFTAPAEAPKKLAKGDVVLVTVVTSAVCGVVREMKGEQASVGFLWGSKPDSRDFARGDVLRVSGQVEFGAPVLAKTDDGWKLGVVVHTDKTTAWLAPYEIGQEELKVPLASVRPIDPSKKRKKGDKVVACDFDVFGCIETTVNGTKDDGLSYEIALPADYVGPAGEGAKSTTVSVCSVTAVPK